MPASEIGLKSLRESYVKLNADIEKRLEEFNGLWKTKSDKKLFAELCFCLLTPQSKARTCWAAVTGLKNKGLLFKGTAGQVSSNINGVRFMNNKAGYIVNVRKQLAAIKKEIRKTGNILELRDWLVKNICGMGYKESSHFLRNIGFGKDIAILDRHILKNLKIHGVIKEIPKSISPKKYFEIEQKMKIFSGKIKIPLSHLDLLFWAKEAGDIFK
ncbi:MAG: N-glycosylase/DNA lyase [Elusimicrobiota bacterium]